MPDRVRLTIPSEDRSLGLVDALTVRFGESLEIPVAETAALAGLVGDVVRFTLAHAYAGDPTGEIEVTLDVVDTTVHVDVHDWGRPLASGGGGLGELHPGLRLLAGRATDLRLINLGSDGKRISFRMPVSHALDTGLEQHDFGTTQRRPETDGVKERLEIRDAGSADLEAVSQLLYENYHLSYGHPDFYRPRWLAEQVAAGRVLSSVALHDGEVVGHHAIMREEEDATSAETGVAVVHSAFRGLGIFDRLFDHTLARADGLALDAVWGRAVTVHPYSQRSERSHGYRESALLLGSVPARMEMQAVEGSEAGRRTASLIAFRVLRPSPRRTFLPTRYRHQLRAAYAHLGLAERAAKAPAPAAPGDSVSWSHDEARATGRLVVTRWDERAAHDAAHATRHLLERHLDVLYADLDLQCLEEADGAVDRLNELGYSYAGLVVCGRGGHDFLRLQRLNAENVELERIVCDSPFAQALLREVLEDLRQVADG